MAENSARHRRPQSADRDGVHQYFHWRAGVVTLTSVGDLIVGQLEADLQSEQMPMSYLFIEPDEDTTPTAADVEQLLAEARAYPSVTTVQAHATEYFYWRTPDETGFIESYVRAFTTPLDALTLDPVQMVTGAWPVAGEQQVAIDRRMAERYELAIGDPVVVRVLRDLLDNPLVAAEIPEETWTVGALIYQPYIIGDFATRVVYVPSYIRGKPR